MYGFLRRYPEISARKPESTSLARSRSFNKGNVAQFFEVYQKVLTKTDYSPHRIFNCDEKGISTVPNQPPRILGKKGKKQVGSMSSAERGTNVTVLLCGNAVGEWVPPMFIFPRKKEHKEYLRGAPEGSISCNQASGWMTAVSFLKWLEHFIDYIGCTKERPALLILDGHVSHVKSLDVLLKARESGLEMICFPPHCTHRMQPLDVTAMGPLEIYYSKEVHEWLRNNPGDPVTIHFVAELFTKAYNKVVRSDSLESGFKKCGIYPVDPSVFEQAFVTAHQQLAIVNDDQDGDPVPDGGDDGAGDNQDNGEPATSDQTQGLANTSISTIATADQNSLDLTLPEQLCPLPVIEYKKKKKTNSKRQGKTALVTSSPYVNELSLQEENKILKERLKEAQKENKRLKKKVKVTATVVDDQDGIHHDDGVIVVGKAVKGKRVSKNLKKAAKVKRVLFGEKNEAGPACADQVDKKNATPKTPTAIPSGAFVLVRFKVRGAEQFYAGFFTGKKKESDLEVRFLRKVPTKIPSVTKIRFKFPDEEDIQWVGSADIVLVFQHKPGLPCDGEEEEKGRPRSKRTAGVLELEDDRMASFTPIY
eukprot:sb/3463275/